MVSLRQVNQEYRMDGLKVITVLVIVVLLGMMFELWRAGRRLADSRDTYVLGQHRSLVACIGCLTVLAVALIEGQVRLSPAPYTTSSAAVLWFHLFLDALLVLIFTMIIVRFTGLTNPVWHRRLAYSFFAIYGGVILSGGVLLYQLPIR